MQGIESYFSKSPSSSTNRTNTVSNTKPDPPINNKLEPPLKKADKFDYLEADEHWSLQRNTGRYLVRNK